MRIILSVLALSAVIAFSAGTSSAQPAASAPGSTNVAQNMAQNAGVDDFQFNELDFDRQGQGRAAAVPAPTERSGDNLVDLFSDQPTETLHNLPGVPSPTSTPAAEGQAKIELSGGSGQPAAPATASAAPARRSSGRRRVQPMRPPEAQVGNHWYWASEAWRENPGAALSDCQSYVVSRPLYHVRCFANVAQRNYPRSYTRFSR
jgi:hypothetical protein